MLLNDREVDIVHKIEKDYLRLSFESLKYFG